MWDYRIELFEEITYGVDIYDVTVSGKGEFRRADEYDRVGFLFVATGGEGGVKNSQQLCDIICVEPLRILPKT